MRDQKRYTSSQTAKILGVTPSWVRQLAAAGEIKAEKIHSPVGPYWLIDDVELRRVAAIRGR